MKQFIIDLIVVVVFVVIAFGVAGYNDADEETAALEHYCGMVESGAWPDFREHAILCNLLK